MEELKKLLTSNYPGIDFDNEKNLVDDGILDSVTVVEIISFLEDAFDISVSMEYIQPKYFNSMENMWEMIQELS